jgi:hypothetical protein
MYGAMKIKKIDETMFDAHRLGNVCIRPTVSFVSKPSERIPIYESIPIIEKYMYFFAAHTSVIYSAVPFGISLEIYVATERLIWYQPEAPQT